jgi:guanylate cyclase soluble subunit beta
MIHKGVRAMVIDQLGDEAWQATERKLGIGPTELITGMVYEDTLTLEIIAEAAARLNLPIEDCLVEFGRYWIKFADRGPFGPFLDFTGHDLPTFVTNLDRMHLAVGTAMPKAQLPSFSLRSISEGRLEVEYRSERTGLEKFVLGLFYGLMERFNVTGSVQVMDSSGDATILEIIYTAGA